MNTESKNFPKNADVKDILYLIWQELAKQKAPSFVDRYEVNDITAIDSAILDKLECGDQVQKITGNMKHLYVVSYKGVGVGQGICLTYSDASLIETVSYDYTENGWVYNSTDKWEKE